MHPEKFADGRKKKLAEAFLSWIMLPMRSYGIKLFKDASKMFPLSIHIINPWEYCFAKWEGMMALIPLRALHLKTTKNI